MKTADLIDALAAGIKPVRPARLSPVLIAGAFAAAALAVLIVLGPRGDLGAAIQGDVFWMKAGYTGSLAVAALWLVSRLGRPGASVGLAGWAVAAVVGLAGLAGTIELLTLPQAAWMADLTGTTWKVCALNIFAVSAVTAPLIFLTARRLAATQPTLAGAAVGLLSGAIAATAYGLHCPEQTAAFLAVWYTFGMAAAAAGGAIIGRFALRW